MIKIYYERSWHLIRIGIETLLSGNWHRFGASDFYGFIALYFEMATYYTQISGIVLGGDLNVHHKHWLRFSREDTRIGSELNKFCDFYGLLQVAFLALPGLDLPGKHMWQARCMQPVLLVLTCLRLL